MAAIIAKKILKETAGNQFGLADPYFEEVPATRLDGRPSKTKTKKVRKALPPGLSEHDAKILTKVKRRAYRLDMSFGSFMGMKLGWGSFIGLLPFAGDIVDMLLALMVVRTAKQVEGGLPVNILAQMYIIVFIDFVAGLVPFVGDIADTIILANTRNAIALEDYLRKKGKKNLRQSNLPVPEVDPSDPTEFDRFNAGQVDTSNYPPQESGVAPERPQQSQPSQPAQARVHDGRQGGSRKSFFGLGSQRSRPADLETGVQR
ncbi:hypothetical protein F5Y05DRAFT_399416 [Hypoxylon sp. FL0543]|nr:hypothetical protein F5Y05DRAFT_399416 [Hypoxylon sp. FL0543]